MVAQTVVAFAAAVANIAYWWHVATRGAEKLRKRVERRYGITIELRFRGSWAITSGPADFKTRFAVGLRHVGYFAGAFFVWSVVLLAVVVIQQRAG